MTLAASVMALFVVAGALTDLRRRRFAAARLTPEPRPGAGGGGRSVRSLLAHRAIRRDLRHLDRDLPALAEAMGREIRAGATVALGLTRAAASLGGVAGDGVARVDREVAAGRSLVVALRSWADDVRSPALDHVVATVALAGELGGASAGAFEAVAAGLRDRAEVDDEISSLTAQSRASAALLTGLPAAATALLAMLEPATIRFLVGSVAGWVCLTTASVLLLGGWWWMNRMVGAVR